MFQAHRKYSRESTNGSYVRLQKLALESFTILFTKVSDSFAFRAAKLKHVFHQLFGDTMWEPLTKVVKKGRLEISKLPACREPGVKRRFEMLEQATLLTGWNSCAAWLRIAGLNERHNLFFSERLGRVYPGAKYCNSLLVGTTKGRSCPLL